MQTIAPTSGKPVPPTEAHVVRQPSIRSVLAFTVFRYVVYVLLFARGVVAAKVLGPYLLGVYGFATVILQYLAYCGLGLQYAVNVELATQHDSNDRSAIGGATALTVVVGAGIVIVCGVIQWLQVPLFSRYAFGHYAFLVGLIAATSMLQQIYTNIFRACGKLSEIAVSEFFCALLLLILTCFLRSWTLIYALLFGWAVSGAFAIALFAARMPFKTPLRLEPSRVRSLLALGLPLLVYNASFSAIAIIAQSAISIYYSVETLGYYTLAAAVANAVLLGFSSISWIAFPNILAKAHSLIPDAEAARTADRVNVLFGTGTFLIVFLGILGLPLFFWILPAYSHSREPLIALLLSQALLSTSLGYNCLAVARNEQMAVAKLSLISVLFVTASAAVVGISHLAFVWIAVAVLAGSILFTLLQAGLGYKLIGNSSHPMRPILPLGTVISVFLCLAGALLHHSSIGAGAGATLFCLANQRRVVELFQTCQQQLSSHGLRRAAPDQEI